MRPWKESILLIAALLVTQLIQTMSVYTKQIDSRSLRDKNVDTGGITLKPKDPSASRDSILTGSIEVKLILVGLSAGGIKFQVNMGIPFHADNPGAQIQGPDIHVASHPVAPVKLEILQAADAGEGDVAPSPRFSEQVEQTSRLVDKVSGTGSPGSITLVLGVAGIRYGSEQKFERHAVILGRQNVLITDIPVGESRELNLYEKVTPGFHGKHQFTVRPILGTGAIQVEPAD